jgi:hypothetical protein
VPILTDEAEYRAIAADIRRVIAKRTGWFNVAFIADDLRSAGLNVETLRVARVLRRMRKQRELRIVVRGGGGISHQYEKTLKFGVTSSD